MAEKDYSKLDKAELIKIVEKLESRKKYGLIWDEEKVKEQFEKDAENSLPVLKEVKAKEIVDKDPSKPINFLIEGDNYHTLSVLNFTHQGKIDVIYIDPPYNTGDTSWKYNNDFVDKEDTYRHSKWISFMNKRLVLARSLLKEDGTLICAIDENEQPRLGIMLEEIFPKHEIVCVSIVHNPRGIQGTNFSYCHEYAYFVYPGDGKKYISTHERTDPSLRNLRDSGGESMRTDAKTCFYPIIVKGGKIIGFGDVPDQGFHPKGINEKKNDGSIYIWPIDSTGDERKWRYSRSSVEEIIENLRVKEVKDKFDIYLYKDEDRYKTVWIDSKYDASEYGTKLIKRILGPNTFAFPKSINVVKECLLAVAKDKKDAIILDYFAGSGTTGHAVLEINKKDQGNRSFILCTNNENGICEEVCYPRIKSVIKGYTDKIDNQSVDGLDGQLKYFKTKFVKKRNNGDDFKSRITAECIDMLCLREGVFDEVKKTDQYRVFQHGNKTVAVYHSIAHTSLSALKSDLENIEGEKILYCFTLDSTGLSEKEFVGWQGVSLQPIPQAILDVYNQIYDA